MQSPSITFLFPHPAAGPTGGYQVVYEYANRLSADGWTVHIVYSGSIYYSEKPLHLKLTNIVRQLQSHLMGYSGRKWFSLVREVREHLSFSLNYRHVPQTDIYVATSPYTAFYLNQYPIGNEKKYYFIQGKEDWGPGLRKILLETYHYKMQKIVIARWLQKMLSETGESSFLVPNGFDFNKFSMTVPIENKDPLCITMLYHEMERKDCQMGFRALEIVKAAYPQLRVCLFGVPKRPDNLPKWHEYFQQPAPYLHNRINNESAIYIGTSQTEGWGLTVGEAMICGQAVCCTDNQGYLEMATDGETALVSPIKDSEALARNIIRLIENKELRHRMARCGNEYIQQFTWEKSYAKLKKLLKNEACLF